MKKITLFSEFKKAINNTNGEVFKIGDVISKVSHLERSTSWKRMNNNPNCMSYYFTIRMLKAGILTRTKRGHYKANIQIPDYLSSSAIEFLQGRNFYDYKKRQTRTTFKGYTREELRNKVFNSKPPVSHRLIGIMIWFVDLDKHIKISKKIADVIEIKNLDSFSFNDFKVIFDDNSYVVIDSTRYDDFSEGYEIDLIGQPKFSMYVVPTKEIAVMGLNSGVVIHVSSLNLFPSKTPEPIIKKENKMENKMENAELVGQSVFLNYEFNVKYGPNGCVEEVIKMQIVLYKNKAGLIDWDPEYVDSHDLKVFGELKKFKDWTERKEFIKQLDSVLNIDSDKEEQKQIDAIFNEQFKNKLIEKYKIVFE